MVVFPAPMWQALRKKGPPLGVFGPFRPEVPRGSIRERERACPKNTGLPARAGWSAIGALSAWAWKYPNNVASDKTPLLYVPRSRPHINFGHSQLQRKIIPKCRSGIPRVNFSEFPGSAFFFALLYSLMGNPEVFRNFQKHVLSETFW